MSDANKELVRRAWAAYDAGDAEGFAACVAPDWREYGTPDPSEGFYTLDDERRTMESHKIAFPDKHTELHRLVADGEYVASSCTISATHTGPYLGLAPTGKRVELYERMINRIRNGRISESWAISTGAGFFEELTARRPPNGSTTWANPVANADAVVAGPPHGPERFRCPTRLPTAREPPAAYPSRRPPALR